ncbi:MAG: HTH-type transcriptional activator IlvY [Actinomycetota bacterium]
MNIRTLRQFIVLAEMLHYGRASQAANVSTSALSRTIRQLETSVGVRLVERDNRSVELTPAGDSFLHYARDAVLQWEQVCFELTDPADRLHGEVSLYCSVTASHSILVDLLDRFRPEHPGVEIRLQTGDPEFAIDRVVALEEEVAIAALPDRLPAGVVYRPIRLSPLVFIAPVDSTDATLAVPTDPQDWEHVPMILAASGIARDRVDAWFRDRGVAPRIYAQVAGNEAIVSMVSLGLGVGVVPQIVLDNSPREVRVRTLDVEPELAPYELGLFTLRRHLRNPLVQAFWSLVDEKG